MSEPTPDDELPDDPAELRRLLETVDPAEAPELVQRIAAALELALRDERA
jgi:hypothetical protein